MTHHVPPITHACPFLSVFFMGSLNNRKNNFGGLTVMLNYPPAIMVIDFRLDLLFHTYADCRFLLLIFSMQSH